MPENPEENLILAVQLSCIDSMLQVADEVLSLAAEHPKQAKALAASASVILGAALEQGVWNRLQLDAKTWASANKGNPCQTPYSELLKDSSSLRRRMVELPKIISDGEFQLNPNSPHVRQLHELVNIRNELMHLKDEVTVLDASRGQFRVRGGKAVLDLNLPSPEFVWGNVTPEQARRFRQAVGSYFEEVLNANDPPGLTAGRILNPAAHLGRNLTGGS